MITQIVPIANILGEQNSGTVTLTYYDMVIYYFTLAGASSTILALIIIVFCFLCGLLGLLIYELVK
jgi:hypothetical protein